MRYLLVLSEELNFTRAAARLGLAQSALSTQVRRLERHLGLPLFVRSHRSVELTPAGAELVGRARRLLAEARQVEHDLRSRAHRPTVPRALRVVAETLHPELVDQLSSRHPTMLVTLRHDTAEAGVAALETGQADLVHGWDLPTVPLAFRPGVAQVTLVDEPMWAVVPADSPLAGEDRISLAQLRDAAWVSPSPGTRRAKHLQAVCQTSGFRPKVRYVVDDQAMVRSLLGNGSCVDIAPPRHLPDGCRAVPLVEDVRARLFYAWRTDTVPSWLAREVLDHTRRSFLGSLVRWGPRYIELIGSDPALAATLAEEHPVGWPAPVLPDTIAPSALSPTG